MNKREREIINDVKGLIDSRMEKIVKELEED